MRSDKDFVQMERREGPVEAAGATSTSTSTSTCCFKGRVDAAPLTSSVEVIDGCLYKQEVEVDECVNKKQTHHVIIDEGSRHQHRPFYW